MILKELYLKSGHLIKEGIYVFYNQGKAGQPNLKFILNKSK